jgi:GxxExxY protein
MFATEVTEHTEERRPRPSCRTAGPLCELEDVGGEAVDAGGGDPLTQRIIGAAIEVHRILGPGLLELIYEEALCHEFDLRGIRHERQKEADVVYKGKTLKGQRLDLVVEGAVVVELKAVRKLHEHVTAQVLSYLKSTGLRVGLVLNFGAERLTDGVKRISL